MSTASSPDATPGHEDIPPTLLRLPLPPAAPKAPLPPPTTSSDEPEILIYNWWPEESPDRIRVEATIPRVGVRRVLKFELEWARLDVAQQSQVYGILARHSEGADDHLERVLTVSWLYDLALQQTSTKGLAERQAEVGEALTIPIPERLPSRIQDPPVQIPKRPPSEVQTPPVQTYLDSMPMSDGRRRFHAILLKGKARVDLDFTLSLIGLAEGSSARADQLSELVENWGELQDSQYQYGLITWLLDESLKQEGIPDQERYKRIVQLLRHGSPTPQPPPTRDGYGISPGLLLIDHKTRARLLEKHRIDVNELQQESERLYRDVSRFWAVIPHEVFPPTNQYFIHAARAFDQLSIEHHKKVLEIGKLLHGNLSQALIALAKASIKGLSATNEDKPSNVNPTPV